MELEFIVFALCYYLRQIMDPEFIRRTRILDYVTFIMMNHFGELKPQVIKLPEGENSDEILALVGVQFKALVELGLVIEAI